MSTASAAVAAAAAAIAVPELLLVVRVLELNTPEGQVSTLGQRSEDHSACQLLLHELLVALQHLERGCIVPGVCFTAASWFTAAAVAAMGCG